MQDLKQTQNEKVAIQPREKKPYVTPHLIRQGKLEEITQQQVTPPNFSQTA